MRSRVWTHVDWRGGSFLSALGLTAGLLSIALLVGLLVPAAAAATPRAAGERVVAPEGSLGLAGLVNQTSFQRGFDVYYRQGDGHVLTWFSLRDGNQIPLREGQHRSPKYGWRHIEASHPEANYWNIQEEYWSELCKFLWNARGLDTMILVKVSGEMNAGLCVVARNPSTSA